ncbi:hypothetical protein ACFYYR_17000 [Streptomyces sp. NPDC001922]|uniref:hypothetical protein n=1 Tax=Streptomyces sp. NPDC001922 TaxID=3364624 RepID=UPI0036C2FF6C
MELTPVPRPLLLTATALSAGAALLLTACGASKDEPENDDKIAGAQQNDKPSGEPTPESTNSVRRPDIKIPKSFEMSFVGWTSSDARTQAVLQDGKERVRSLHAAIMEGNPEASYVPFYSRGSGLLTGQQWIKGFVKKNLTLTGSARFYNPQASVRKDGSAQLDYCADQSKGYSKDLKTKKVNKEPASSDDYVLYKTKLEKDRQGVWQTTAVMTMEGSCKP